MISLVLLVLDDRLRFFRVFELFLNIFAFLLFENVFSGVISADAVSVTSLVHVPDDIPLCSFKGIFSLDKFWFDVYR